MSEGRNELEQALQAWEARHAVAARAKREAEVVMPFLKAAIEELENFRSDGTEANSAPAATPAAPVAAAPPAPAAEVEPKPEPEMPSPFDGNFDLGEEDTEPAEEATEFPSSFQPRAISALMDEEDEGEEAAAS